jgi:hypothetical protein
MFSQTVKVLVFLLLVSLPAVAGDRVIQNGIDLWVTRGDGSTFIDFTKAPIPAGFFCFKSQPFAERIVFRGVPVATAEPGILGETDTIVERLEDAVFNKSGVALTRIRMRALHFESIRPVQTTCGSFKVEVKLNGEQPVTRMRIVRDSPTGGHFFAPISVNGKLVFTPIGGNSTEVLELTRNIRFPAPRIEWADRVGAKAIRLNGFVLTDTDADRLPDTYLPGTSNFGAGWPSRPGLQPLGQKTLICHEVEDPNGEFERHCPSET